MMQSDDNSPPPKYLMTWPNDVVLEFLELYGAERLLWDPKHPSHRNRPEVADAWKRIQTSLSIRTSVSDLKRKKESLMTSFRMHLNKKKSQESYTTNWFAFTAMERFLGEKYDNDSTYSDTEMGRQKKRTAEEIRSMKKDAEKRRRNRIKADPNKYAEHLAKENERRNKRKDDKKTRSITDMAPREQRIQRKEWRDRARKCNKMKRIKKRFLEPSTDMIDEEEPERPESPSMMVMMMMMKLLGPGSDRRQRQTSCHRSQEYLVVKKQEVDEAQVAGLKRATIDSYCSYKNNSNTCNSTIIETGTQKRDQDEYDLYGQLLAKKMRKLDERQRDLAMHEIDNIMFRAKMKSESQSSRDSLSTTNRKTTSPVFISLGHDEHAYGQTNMHFEEIHNSS